MAAILLVGLVPPASSHLLLEQTGLIHHHVSADVCDTHEPDSGRQGAAHTHGGGHSHSHDGHSDHAPSPPGGPHGHDLADGVCKPQSLRKDCRMEAEWTGAWAHSFALHPVVRVADDLRFAEFHTRAANATEPAPALGWQFDHRAALPPRAPGLFL